MNLRRWIPHAPARGAVGAVLALALILLAGTLLAPTAHARVAYNTIDDVAAVSGDGRHVDVTGPLEVTAGERVELEVTITQRSTGAVAKGFDRVHRHGGRAALGRACHDGRACRVRARFRVGGRAGRDHGTSWRRH
jgi:hypothetical protein